MLGNALVQGPLRLRLIVPLSAALMIIGLPIGGVLLFVGSPSENSHRSAGRILFEREWRPQDPLALGDGLGPVFNAKSCVACHFQGGPGGGGPLERNVTAFQVLPTNRDPRLIQGIVHAFAVDTLYQESQEQLKQRFPVSTKRFVRGCITIIHDFDPVRIESINTPALFGAGRMDGISDSAIKRQRWKLVLNSAAEEVTGNYKGVSLGRPRILPGGRVGKFGWKSQFATLEEFVAAACANELGLGNPIMKQAKPLTRPTFESRQTDLSPESFSELVGFVAALPRPSEVIPESDVERDKRARGKELFHSIGCATCHTPDLDGVEGIYSDFLLHAMEKPRTIQGYVISNEELTGVPIPKEFPLPWEWKTPPLWGVADSAPYFHDGQSATLRAAIRRHRGSAASVTSAFKKLSAGEEEAILFFLGTLKAPAR